VIDPAEGRVRVVEVIPQMYAVQGYTNPLWTPVAVTMCANAAQNGAEQVRECIREAVRAHDAARRWNGLWMTGGAGI
jgi:hypothetical protein